MQQLLQLGCHIPTYFMAHAIVSHRTSRRVQSTETRRTSPSILLYMIQYMIHYMTTHSQKQNAIKDDICPTWCVNVHTEKKWDWLTEYGQAGYHNHTFFCLVWPYHQYHTASSFMLDVCHCAFCL